MKTEEGNILIAEFMGTLYWKACNSENGNPYWATHYKNESDCLSAIDNHFNHAGLQYEAYKREHRRIVPKLCYGEDFDLSWDDLMPVVEKICNLNDFSMHLVLAPGYSTAIITSLTEGSKSKAKNNESIKAVWLAVVDFIESHNSKAKKA